jgi:Domain of unknown function (DUF4160)
MPTIVKRDGFRVVIYPNDHDPAHVHVIKNSGEVRIHLGNKDLSEKPYLITVEGDISNKDVAKALNLVCEYQSELLIKWSEIHGS